MKHTFESNIDSLQALLKTNIVLVLVFIVSCSQLTENQANLPDPLEAGWNDRAVCEVLEDNEKIRVLQCTFPPGVGHERHYHDAHFGYTLVGSTFRIRDTTGVKEVEVPTGYSFYNEKIEWHEVLNIGDTTAVFFIVEPK